MQIQDFRYSGGSSARGADSAQYFRSKQIENPVVVSPDHGGVVRARKLADFLNAPLAIIDKRRPEPNVSEVMNIIGNIEGKTAILIDDIIDTAGTIVLGANALMEGGVKKSTRAVHIRFSRPCP